MVQLSSAMSGMLNQAAVEAICSATYLENYLDSMDNLPNDLQRIVSDMRERDALTHGMTEYCNIIIYSYTRVQK